MTAMNTEYRHLSHAHKFPLLQTPPTRAKEPTSFLTTKLTICHPRLLRNDEFEQKILSKSRTHVKQATSPRASFLLRVTLEGPRS